MKIAVITDDGTTISQHFGRALKYAIFTIEKQKVILREEKDKVGHHTFGGAEHSHEEHHHGNDAQSHEKHDAMADPIADCEVLICGGMGMGAYQFMVTRKIKPVITDLHEIDEAIQTYIAGNLVDHVEKLH